MSASMNLLGASSPGSRFRVAGGIVLLLVILVVLGMLAFVLFKGFVVVAGYFSDHAWPWLIPFPLIIIRYLAWIPGVLIAGAAILGVYVLGAPLFAVLDSF
jgi:hypothetical protein